MRADEVINFAEQSDDFLKIINNVNTGFREENEFKEFL